MKPLTPKKLFKYMPPERVSDLKNQTIRFTPAKELNDPFELLPMEASLFNEEEIKNQIGKSLKKNFNEHRKLYDKLIKNKNLPPHIKFEKFEQEYNTLLKKSLRETTNYNSPRIYKETTSGLREVGILSLTESDDNLLMWAHYAKNHTGVVVEYNPRHMFFQFKKNESDVYSSLKKVTYGEKRTTYNKNDEELKEIFFHKSKEWEYEREWRCLRQKDSADIISKEQNGIWLHRFPPDMIKTIILGCRISERHESEIIEIFRTNSLYKHVEIRKMELSKSYFSVKSKRLRFKQR